MPLTKREKRMKTTKKRTIGVTYSKVTPESSEHGDYAEEGWEIETEAIDTEDYGSIAEAVDCAVARYGPFETSDGETFYSVDADRDYRTGVDTFYAVHIGGCSIPTLYRIAKALGC